MRGNIHRGFTLIELLTVIAIIALLAAILFPTLKTVGDRTRNANCMANMHEIWRSLKLYKQDEQAPPSALFGYAEDPGGAPNLTGTGFVEADRILHAFLYTRTRLNDAEKFHCPYDRPSRKDAVTIAHFAPQPSRWPVRPGGAQY